MSNSSLASKRGPLVAAAPIQGPTRSSPNDLESRVERRKREWISEIVEHKKNSSRASAGAEIDRARAKLLDLAYILKAGVTSGWANVSPSATLRLDEWIAS